MAEIRPLKLLLDINVFLDFLQSRGAFSKSAAELFAAIEMKRAAGHVAAIRSRPPITSCAGRQALRWLNPQS